MNENGNGDGDGGDDGDGDGDGDDNDGGEVMIRTSRCVVAIMAVRTSVCTHVRNVGDGDGGDDVADNGGDACRERVPDVQPCTSGTRSRRATLHLGNARKLNKL